MLDPRTKLLRTTSFSVAAGLVALVAAQANCGGSASDDRAGGDAGGPIFAADGGPLGCVGLACRRPTHCTETGANTTTISGRVFDPAGKNALYNVIVYVPNEPVAPIADGASCDRCGGTITGKPISVALTDANGTFTLEDAPAGADVPIVIQVGKWRREIVLPRAEPCVDTVVEPALTRLPKNRREGHIPRIAVATGAADAFECLLRKVGVDDDEFGTRGDDARIHLYAGYGYDDGAPHVAASRFASGTSFAGAQALWNDVAELSKYDMTLLACEGEEDVAANRSTKPTPGNLYDYAKAGGRVFAAHYHKYWFAEGSEETKSLGAWANLRRYPAFPQPALSPVDGTIDTSFPKGQALFDWLTGVDALTPGGKLVIKEARHDLDRVEAGRATTWIRTPKSAQEAAGETDVAQYVTFNAPIGAPDTALCGRVVFSDLHVSSGNSLDTPGKDFPTGCVTPDLSPQEKALEFMLFDLSSCVQSDNVKPVAPK